MKTQVKHRSIRSSAETSTEVSNSATQGQSIFNGEIESISEPDDSTIQIKVINVKEIKDPENIGSSFTNDGVILNASEEQLKRWKRGIRERWIRSRSY